MRGLFFKIFAIFWIAQSLIFVISTALIIRHRVPHPEFVLNALFDDVQYESSEATSAFESGGCASLDAIARKRGNSFVLEDENGATLCPSAAPFAVPHGLGSVTEATAKEVGDHYLWRAPVVSKTGKKYLFLLFVPQLPKPSSWFQDVFHFAFPQLPVAIAIGGVTTFVLVMLFTRPVIRLRRAARELAQGNLNARVPERDTQLRTFQGDEFHALVHDFNYMAERLQLLVDAQKLLLRDVSHELRSPLARLNVALELAREDADPEGRIEPHLARIERETERLNKLIGQLLTLSSMEAIDQTNSFESVSLSSLIEQIIPDAMYEAKQRQCSISFHADRECIVSGSKDLLHRAIENIVRNAIRYTEQGSEVEIDLTTLADKGQAVLEISDRGPGIPENEIHSIFLPFYRVDRARSPETGGFGVGLAIAERAMKLHHGEITATNRVGGGTTVRLSFPLAKNGQDTKPAHKTAAQSN